jgi:hypothetical protein
MLGHDVLLSCLQRLLRFLVIAYDWIANNSRSTPIAGWSGGFWLAKPVE